MQSSEGFFRRTCRHVVKATVAFGAALACFCWCCAFAVSHSSFLLIAILGGAGLLCAAYGADQLQAACLHFTHYRNWLRWEADMRKARL